MPLIPGLDDYGAPPMGADAGGPPPIDVPPPPSSGQGDPHGPDRGDHTDDLNTALSAMDSYVNGETDEADISLAREIMAKIAKLRASQQDLVDKATGAGPGARLMRKASAGGGGGL